MSRYPGVARSHRDSEGTLACAVGSRKYPNRDLSGLCIEAYTILLHGKATPDGLLPIFPTSECSIGSAQVPHGTAPHDGCLKLPESDQKELSNYVNKVFTHSTWYGELKKSFGRRIAEIRSVDQSHSLPVFVSFCYCTSEQD